MEAAVVVANASNNIAEAVRAKNADRFLTKSSGKVHISKGISKGQRGSLARNTKEKNRHKRSKYE